MSEKTFCPELLFSEELHQLFFKERLAEKLCEDSTSDLVREALENYVLEEHEFRFDNKKDVVLFYRILFLFRTLVFLGPITTTKLCDRAMQISLERDIEFLLCLEEASQEI